MVYRVRDIVCPVDHLTNPRETVRCGITVPTHHEKQLLSRNVPLFALSRCNAGGVACAWPVGAIRVGRLLIGG